MFAHRRTLLAAVSVLTVLMLLAACAATPQTVEKVVTQVVKETVMVEGTPQVVEKEVTSIVVEEIEVTSIVVEEKEVEKVVTATAPPGSRTLVVGMDMSSAYSMDPHANFEPVASFVGYQCYDNLVRMTPDNWFEPAPALAESWEWSYDGLALTFHLRPDVKFASGNPLTAEDVRFTILRHKNKKGDSSGLVSMVKDVEVVDDLTARVTFDVPTPDYMGIATTAFTGIMDSKVVKEHGGTDAEDAAETDQATQWLDQNSASTGAYVLKSWVSESEIVLEANPNYWRGQPYFERIVVRHTPDLVAGFQQVQKGDLDILYRAGHEQVAQAQSDPNIRAYIPTDMNILHMNMTCDPELSKPLSDKRVRQAINLALDRTGLIYAALAGHGNATPSIIPIGMPGVDPEQVPQRDVEKAQALLVEAGYENGFTETFYYSPGGNFDTVAAKIQADLADIGITVILNPMDSSQLMSRVWGDYDVPWYMDTWAPDYIGYTIWTDWWGYNDWHAANFRCEVPPELAEASKIIATGLDPEKRLQAVKDWQAIMMYMAYSFVIYQFHHVYLLRADIQGFGVSPLVFDAWSLSR